MGTIPIPTGFCKEVCRTELLRCDQRILEVVCIVLANLVLPRVLFSRQMYSYEWPRGIARRCFAQLLDPDFHALGSRSCRGEGTLRQGLHMELKTWVVVRNLG
jgi:hypothetical protein